ncbi:hypothetical protein CNR22_20695 [Sphingobacteriaceae bacterium]|nr:hypothetical protein CNR22_20695 [Sphingobacteriaceae bacterium]
MVENISARELIEKVIEWRKKFLWITIVTAIVTGVIVFLMPKQYKSTAIVFPARQFSVSKLVIEANAGNQEDYMMYGDADDCEKLMQIFATDDIKIKVADRFNLWERWKLKDTVFALHFLKQKWDDQVTIKRTEYNSIKIEVLDYTADSAAFVANGISDYCDSIRFDMNRKLSGQVLKIVKMEYDSTIARMKILEDSLNVLRGLGVFHYKEQVKAYSKSYAKAIEKNDVAAMKRFEAKFDTLKKYGGAYQNIHDNLEKYGSKYPDIKMKYDEAKVNYNTLVPNKFVVQKAQGDEFKAKPKRMTIIAITVLAANFMGLFFLLFRDKFGKAEH